MKLRGLKLRGLTWNQIKTPYLIYEIDQGKKLNILDDFENKTLTHMSATHAISKIEHEFQNQIPRNSYPQNRHDLLSQFQFHRKKLYRKVIPEFDLFIHFSC